MVTLDKVLRQAGLDYSNSVDDAKWIVSRSQEFEEIIARADAMIEEYEEYLDFIETQETNITFKKWRKMEELINEIAK